MTSKKLEKLLKIGLLIAAASVAVYSLYACGKKSDSPENVTRKYLACATAEMVSKEMGGGSTKIITCPDYLPSVDDQEKFFRRLAGVSGNEWMISIPTNLEYHKEFNKKNMGGSNLIDNEKEGKIRNKLSQCDRKDILCVKEKLEESLLEVLKETDMKIIENKEFSEMRKMMGYSEKELMLIGIDKEKSKYGYPLLKTKDGWRLLPIIL